MTSAAHLIIDNVTKMYASTKQLALKGISLTINRGDFFGLLGPNGSGKTTLISIICGLLPATNGRVIIDGKILPNQLAAIKPLLGHVPQELALYSNLTAKENLKFFGQLYGLTGKLLKQRVDECLEITCLKNFAKRRVGTFSGGMKRRANLVISLLHRPSILFLDEPTVNVDPQSRDVIFNIVKQLNQAGTTIILTTHYLEEAEELCNQVAIIDTGAVITVDSPKNLIANTPGCGNLGEVFLQLTGHQLRD